MPRYRSFDVGFKRQVAQEFLTGESLNSFQGNTMSREI